MWIKVEQAHISAAGSWRDCAGHCQSYVVFATQAGSGTLMVFTRVSVGCSRLKPYRNFLGFWYFSKSVFLELTICLD